MIDRHGKTWFFALATGVAIGVAGCGDEVPAGKPAGSGTMTGGGAGATGSTTNSGPTGSGGAMTGSPATGSTTTTGPTSGPGAGGGAGSTSTGSAGAGGAGNGGAGGSVGTAGAKSDGGVAGSPSDGGGPSTCPATGLGGAGVVKIVKNGTTFSMTRDGAPYYVKGIDGGFNLDLAQASGVNSLRTFDSTGAQALLDSAASHCMTVSLGVSLSNMPGDYTNQTYLAGKRTEVTNLLS